MPRGPRVLARVFDDNERPSGIVLPPGTAARPSRGVIVHVGKGYRRDDGTWVPLDLNPGDEVMFFISSGTEIMLDGESLYLLNDQDILLVLQEAFVVSESP